MPWVKTAIYITIASTKYIRLQKLASCRNLAYWNGGRESAKIDLAKNIACVGCPPPQTIEKMSPISMKCHSLRLKDPTSFISVHSEYCFAASPCFFWMTRLLSDFQVVDRFSLFARFAPSRPTSNASPFSLVIRRSSWLSIMSVRASSSASLSFFPAAIC